MSDPNQQCLSNWTITGCGRRAINNGVCDSVTSSVCGRTYSYVCGRILAFQRGYSGAFFCVIHIVQQSRGYSGAFFSCNSYSTPIETTDLSGASLTHGPAGSRQHIWSFVAASKKKSLGQL